MIRIINSPFELDPYPGDPKILFIGLGASTHTLSWIDLLSNTKLNVRLFSVPGGGIPPADWKTRTYICAPSAELPESLDPGTRQSFYPLSKDIKLFKDKLERLKNELEDRKTALERKRAFRFFASLKQRLDSLGQRWGMPPLDYVQDADLKLPHPEPRAASPEEWLAQIIQEWQPDIIHTLGLFDGQGGAFYYNARKVFHLENIGIWLLELRGGSDIALRQYNPETAKQIFAMFSECDQINTDNYFSIEYIEKLGFAKKIAGIAPIPATGGMEVETNIQNLVLPSNRQRVIFWPKAYETIWSKALPVIEAIKLAWNEIKPCTIYMTAINSEAEAWLATLPEEIKKSCHIEPRIPRAQALQIMKQARVMLAPSLVDGLPNVLVESMANGAFPIVSPLESITSLVSEPENVLFVRNLYPEEISSALIRAMSDDLLVNNAAQNNLQLVAKIADRTVITVRVAEYYEKLRKEKVKSNSEPDFPLVTLITPTYNRASLLDETVYSVLSQDYPNIEYIILDDGSKDNTKEVMEKFRERVIFESHENMGETRTVNKGFEMAKGEFICVVNSDDPILPGAISKMVAALQADPEALAVYPDWVEIDPQSRPIKEIRLPNYDISNMLNDFNVALGPGNIFRRSALETYGFRETNRTYTGDLEFWFRLAAHGKLLHISEILATHRTHPHSASISDKSSKMAEELLSIVKSLFASGGLPKEIQDRQDQILSRVYYVSIFYCQREPARKFRYFLLAFFYDPKRITMNVFGKMMNVFGKIVNRVLRIRNLIVVLLWRVYRFLIYCMSAFLRIILPEKTYNALRAWRHSSKKTNS